MLDVLTPHNSHTMPSFSSDGGAYSRADTVGGQVDTSLSRVAAAMPELRAFAQVSAYQQETEQRIITEAHQPQNVWEHIDRHVLPSAIFGSSLHASPQIQQLSGDFREYARAMDRFQRQNTEQLQLIRAQEQQARARNLARRYANTDERLRAPNEQDAQRAAQLRESNLPASNESTELICGICLDEYLSTDPVVVLSCGRTNLGSHNFHQHCIDAWIAHSAVTTDEPKCPHCRAVITVTASGMLRRCNTA